MRDIIVRAWKDTARSYGLTLGTGIRSIIVPIATFLLFYHVLGGPEAVSEGSKIALSIVAAVGAGFLPLFLWHLWLAPYKILREELERVATTSPSLKVVDEEAMRRLQNSGKTQMVRQEMETIRYCLEEREIRKSEEYFPTKSLDFDYDFVTLREKYISWFPKNMVDEKEMMDWCGRVISVLKAYDYEEAVARIEQAASSKSWAGKRGNF